MWSRPLNPMKSEYASQMLLIDNPVWLLFSCVGLDCFIRNSNFSDGPVSTQSDNPCVVLPGAWVRPLSWSLQQFYVNRLPILSALEIGCFQETFKVFLLMQWMWSPWHRTLWGITSKCHRRGTATSPAQSPPPSPRMKIIRKANCLTWTRADFAFLSHSPNTKPVCTQNLHDLGHYENSTSDFQHVGGYALITCKCNSFWHARAECPWSWLICSH